MASRALAWWLALPQEQRDVKRAIQAVKLARVELTAARMAAKSVKDSWFLTHGTSVTAWRATAQRCADELGAAQRGLEAIATTGASLKASQLPAYLRRAVELVPDDDRKGLADPSHLVTVPLIAWPSSLRSELDAEGQARAQQDWKALINDIRESAAERAAELAPQASSAAIIAGLVLGGVAVTALAVGVAVAMGSRA